MVVVIGLGSKYLEHIFSIRTKITLSNRILNNQINRTTENEQEAE
jgi:hypothetical protein